ncbi:hypothetical protein PS862_02975 [Pseudomonas fluorescens]|uniref:diguanylate cyclase n=1 Tax=Pseudomonas fluorescens TaxID=294 RepID=A0A5E7KU28_PSEFL|nr:hypothetical protein PS639_01365 [Pseudomonas fluorescens]VVP03573.1 hypothetical protein PS862_02975 [Pseudomonas fluorescens]
MKQVADESFFIIHPLINGASGDIHPGNSAGHGRRSTNSDSRRRGAGRNNRVRSHVEEQRYAYHGKQLRLTVSIGLTTLQADDTLHTLLSRADQAMYRAKHSGRNRICMEMSHSSYA